eukprot:7929596-Ditylum_brightwellii.AAC.1
MAYHEWSNKEDQDANVIELDYQKCKPSVMLPYLKNCSTLIGHGGSNIYCAINNSWEDLDKEGSTVSSHSLQSQDTV